MDYDQNTKVENKQTNKQKFTLVQSIELIQRHQHLSGKFCKSTVIKTLKHALSTVSALYPYTDISTSLVFSSSFPSLDEFSVFNYAI